MQESPNLVGGVVKPPSFEQLTVLLLEDQPVQREILVAKLRKIGLVNIIDVADGEAALACLNDENRPIDIAVVDLMMDGMDGLEFLRLAEARSEKMPAIIVVSAAETSLLDSVSSMAQARGYELLATLAKPVSVVDLTEVLAAFCHRRGETEGGNSMSLEVLWSVEELQAALQLNQIEAYYQPKVSASLPDKVVGVEALSRWVHPEYGKILPSSFLPVMEYNGLLSAFDRLILQQAIEQLRTFIEQGLDLTVSVNLTAKELADLQWLDNLCELVEQHRLPPSRLIFEVTETVALSRDPDVAETLARLRIKGFGLAIDDFGTGYSSLSNFRRVAFTELKIDRCLTENLYRDPSHQKIVNSIISLGHELGLAVVAEAVEDQRSIELLSQFGCDMVQGLVVAPALSADEIIPWCLEHS